jgi:hypothetical protein
MVSSTPVALAIVGHECVEKNGNITLDRCATDGSSVELLHSNIVKP